MITKHVVLSCEYLKAKRSAPITSQWGGLGGEAPPGDHLSEILISCRICLQYKCILLEEFEEK